LIAASSSNRTERAMQRSTRGVHSIPASKSTTPITFDDNWGGLL
jgi:hypothetical protein